MSTITGTLKGVQLISESPSGDGNRKVYLCTYDFGAYTGASDDATVTGVTAAIESRTRDGVALTLRWGAAAHAGSDTNNQAVYVGACTVSTDDLTFNLANAAGTELTSATASTGVGIMVGVDET